MPRRVGILGVKHRSIGRVKQQGRPSTYGGPHRHRYHERNQSPHSRQHTVPRNPTMTASCTSPGGSSAASQRATPVRAAHSTNLSQLLSKSLVRSEPVRLWRDPSLTLISHFETDDLMTTPTTTGAASRSLRPRTSPGEVGVRRDHPHRSNGVHKPYAFPYTGTTAPRVTRLSGDARNITVATTSSTFGQPAWSALGMA